VKFTPQILSFLNKALIPFTGMFALFIFPASAQDADSTRNKELDDVVITGQYGENTLHQSVYKMKVIDSKRIQQQGAVNLKDVLANEVNIRINQDPALGSSISLQGVTGQNIKILIDGVPVIGREGGNIDLNQINLNNVERIEMVEGPMSVSFGTDALGGVINIITKKPAQKQFRANAATYYESIGQYNADAGVAVGGKKLSVQGNAARNFFEGYSEDKDSRFKTWKPREQYMADVTLAYSAKAGKFRMQNSWFDEKVTSRDSGIITPFYAYGLDQYYKTRRITSSVFYDKKLKRDLQVNVLASFNHYRRIKTTVRKDLVTLQEQPTNTPEQNDTNYFYVWMSRGTISRNAQGKRFNYQAGYEVNLEWNEGSKIVNSKQQISDYNIFASAEYRPVSRLVLRPALRAIYNTKFAAPLVPSFNLKWDISSDIKLRASYARGFRAPSLKELYLNFVDPSHNVHGNPNLKAETSDNVQVFLSYEITRHDHVFRIDPGVFYNHITNMIDLKLVNAQTIEATYFNVGEFTSTGVNINSEYRTPAYSILLGYACTGRNSSYSPDNSLYFSNEYRANFSYTLPKRGTSFAIFYKYNGKLQSYQLNYMNNEVEMGYINAFSLLDASISQPFLGKRFLVTAGVKNILDVTNIRASISGGVHQTGGNTAMVAMGRTYFAALRFNLFRQL
jgi:outer membrane receptor for ferrienterochelin and colicins